MKTFTNKNSYCLKISKNVENSSQAKTSFSNEIMNDWFAIMQIYLKNIKYAFVQKNMMNAINMMIVQFIKNYQKNKKKTILLFVMISQN